MMKFEKKKIDMDEIDDMLLENLISHCEDRMSAPYKEKAKAAIVVAEDEPEMDEMEGVVDESDESDMDLDDEKKEKLRKLYAMMKD